MALSDFGKAFKAARDAGDTEFTHGGKKYTTRRKGESDSDWKSGASKRMASKRAESSKIDIPDSKSNSPDIKPKLPSINQDSTEDELMPYTGASGSGIPLRRGGRVKAPAKKAPAKMKCGGKVSKMKCGGTVKKAAGGKVSGRDGIARKGRTSARSC